jgi:F0F1-type ATP synthase membrane subunit c/vacuolar-type H+-ATPase subunit K
MMNSVSAAGIPVCLVAIGGGIYLLRFCSERFMLLRRAKSATPYLYGIGGILSLLLMTLATIGLVICFVGLSAVR